MESDENSCGPPHKSRKTTQETLGSCRICGLKATGFHYGVNSCEPCKGFFRRSLIRKQPYTCVKNEKCQIENGIKNSCPQCRYEKCVKVGMSKEGIRIGRYTYEKKTQNMIDFKTTELEKEQGVSTIPPDNLKKKETGVNLDDAFSKDKHQRQETKSGVALQMTDDIQVPELMAAMSAEGPDTYESSRDSAHMNHSEEPGCTRDAKDCDISALNCTEVPLISANQKTGPDCTSDFSQYPSDKLEEFEDILKVILRAQETVFSNMESNDDVFRLKEGFQTLPDSKFIDIDKFMDIYKSTGTQVDDRLQLIGNWFYFMELNVRKCVTFAKKIPGFQDLPISDQTCLIKFGITEVWLIGWHKEFHVDSKSYMANYRGESQIFDLRKVFGINTCISLLKSATLAQDLCLTEEQTVLLKVLLVFFTDRCKMHDPVKVLRLQDKYMELLLYSFSKSHPRDSGLVDKILTFLLQLKDSATILREYHEQQFLLLCDGGVSMPELFKEVFCMRYSTCLDN